MSSATAADGPASARRAGPERTEGRRERRTGPTCYTAQGNDGPDPPRPILGVDAAEGTADHPIFGARAHRVPLLRRVDAGRSGAV
jgi:hypothetical protein